MVKRGWEKGEGEEIIGRISICGRELQVWGDKIRLRFKMLINQYRDQLHHLKKLKLANHDNQILDIKHKLDMLLIQEEQFWKQRAKIFWLKDGDSNTKCYHNYASCRRRKNSITQLKNSEGHQCGWGTGLHELILYYFQDLFSSRGSVIHQSLSHISSCITDDQNQALLNRFDEKEIKDALFSMHLDTSPGPNGMNPGFYQKFWDITGKQVTLACLNILNQC